MGKDSLLRSTTPKKRTSKTTRKITAKSDSAKRPAGTRKPEVQKPAEDLIFKKFDIQPPPAKSIHGPASKARTESAPPAIEATVMNEAERELIFRRFSMADIQKVAKPPDKRHAETPITRKAQRIYPTFGDAAVSPSPGYNGRPDPVIRSMLYGVAALALMVMLVIGASVRNHSRYYLVSRNDAVEVWRGRFSPTGKAFHGILHNYRLSEPIRPFYAKQEIFPIMFHYYLQRADGVLDMQDHPDFVTITNYLNTASQYALNDQMHQTLMQRKNAIDQMTFLYKADVAIHRGTAHSLELAIQYLNNAKALTRDSVQQQAIEERLALVRAQLAATTLKPSDGESADQVSPPVKTTKP